MYVHALLFSCCSCNDVNLDVGNDNYESDEEDEPWFENVVMGESSIREQEGEGSLWDPYETKTV